MVESRTKRSENNHLNFRIITLKVIQNPRRLALEILNQTLSKQQQTKLEKPTQDNVVVAKNGPELWSLGVIYGDNPLSTRVF